MFRKLLIASAAVAVFAIPVEAKRVARMHTPVEKFVRGDVVVAGKVSAIEKEMVNAIRFPGDTEKVPYKVAIIKIDKGFVGADAITHVKVGFIPPSPANPMPARPVRGGFQSVTLNEGQEGLFFLTKHPSGEFYTITPMMAPLDPGTVNYKAQMEQVTKAAAVFADPVKALKAEKAVDRYFAAASLLTKYRTFPEDGRQTEMVKLSADESKLILKALAEADWKNNEPDTVRPLEAFYHLGLGDATGWKQPQPKPGVDFQDNLRDSFVKWLEGPGKDYQIEKVVPK